MFRGGAKGLFKRVTLGLPLLVRVDVREIVQILDGLVIGPQKPHKRKAVYVRARRQQLRGPSPPASWPSWSMSGKIRTRLPARWQRWRRELKAKLRAPPRVRPGFQPLRTTPDGKLRSDPRCLRQARLPETMKLLAIRSATPLHFRVGSTL